MIFVTLSHRKNEKKMSNIYGIILAGGQGTRAGYGTPKQFININDKPVIIHTLSKFTSLKITGLIVVVPEKYIKHTNKLIKEFAIQKVILTIKGGETRQGSSYNAITCMDFNDIDILIFHDAARPFVGTEIIKKCIKESKVYGASGVYTKATDTIAHIENNFVKQIPDRSELYYTQTPQAFQYKIIKEAHELALSKGIHDPTDDVQLVLNAGYKVKVVNGSPGNIKITSSTDIDLAECISRKEKE